jgi:PAS domain S-box-containing protein
MFGVPMPASNAQAFTRTDRVVSAAAAIRGVAWARCLLAVSVATAGSFIDDPSQRVSWFLLILGLAYLPMAVAILLASDDVTRPLVRFGGPVADLTIVALSHALLPQASGRTPLLFYAFIVAFVTYSEGRLFGAVIAAGSIVLTVVINLGVPDVTEIGVTPLISYTMVAVGTVYLIGRSASDRDEALRMSQHSQTRSAAILEQVADAVVVTDGFGVVASANPATGRVFGVDVSKIAGRSCHEAFGMHVDARPLDCSRSCALIDMCPTGSESSDVWRIAPDGRHQPLLASASPLTDDEGQIVEIVHSIRDVTRLKQADEAKTLFLATASHELRTPLTVISGFAELLRSDDTVDEGVRKEALDAILGRTRELGSIVDRLLLSSRIEAGRTRLHPAPVELEPILAERVESLRQVTGRTIQLDDGDSPRVVWADRDALTTVLDHLLDNALKYSGAKAPVELVARVVDDMAAIRIVDHGIGMDSDQAKHCFEEFWQADSTDSRAFGGTGIGLYIVRSLVEAMGGRIEVSSALGRGSTFSFTLPLTDTSEDHVDLEVEPSLIREFMHQFGVPVEGRS